MKSSYILYKMISLEIKNYSYFKLSVHASTSESEGLDLNLCPSSQFPEFASSASNSPLYPNPTSKIIIITNPIATPIVPIFECSPACDSGINSSTTT